VPRGAEYEFAPEKGDLICDRIAQGETLRRICRDPGMPDRHTVRDWRRAHPEFDAQYAQARIDQAEVYFDDVIDLADETAGEPSEVQAAKLRVDSRKWVLARMDRGKYGDQSSLNLGSQPENPLRVESTKFVVRPEDYPEDEREALLRAAHRKLQS
jgi:transposase-like protein